MGFYKRFFGHRFAPTCLSRDVFSEYEPVVCDLQMRDKVLNCNGFVRKWPDLKLA